jgi:hypothetical protein
MVSTTALVAATITDARVHYGSTCSGMSDGSLRMHVTIRGPAAVIASRERAVSADAMLLRI